MTFYSPSSNSPPAALTTVSQWWTGVRQRSVPVIAAIFLVSVPVFVQAPLVRLLPWLSLAVTVGWLGLGLVLMSRTHSRFWGDLLLGFTWSWLTGSLYWGWLRWEPLLHLPVEALILPLALWGLFRGRGLVGNCFYLGSLLGTAITDSYFYVTHLLPHWRRLMHVEPELAISVFQDAIAHIKTPWGAGWALALASLLLILGLVPLKSDQPHWLVFSGTILGTILVDGLFWMVASSA